mmetsp:Transcript_8175/g.24080  ORF Transcript_8175/g.24080 Transcript_8175/m.24080 type:complete len:202 (-) Transcript_8175:42-647(-)
MPSHQLCGHRGTSRLQISHTWTRSCVWFRCRCSSSRSAELCTLKPCGQGEPSMRPLHVSAPSAGSNARRNWLLQCASACALNAIHCASPRWSRIKRARRDVGAMASALQRLSARVLQTSAKWSGPKDAALSTPARKRSVCCARRRRQEEHGLRRHPDAVVGRWHGQHRCTPVAAGGANFIGWGTHVRFIVIGRVGCAGGRC